MEDNRHTIEFLKDNQYGPFKILNDKLFIPNKYIDILESFNSEIDFENLNATQLNWNLVRNLIISNYWFDTWYTNNLPTIPTEFEELNCIKNYDKPKFLRLTSLSCKTQFSGVYSLNRVSNWKM